MGALLLLPFFLVRFGVLSLLRQEALRRAAYFAPLLGKEKAAYWLYQCSTAAIVIYLFFLKIKYTPEWLFYTGLIIYLAGLILLLVAVVNFASPSEQDFQQDGLYQLSRNPMYAAYFMFFIGCTFLTQSMLLLAFVILFQITAHWIILAEERWCTQKYGKRYLQYMEKVRRYI